MIDTHCHIQTEQFDADREEVIAKAFLAGVTHFIVPAIDKNSFEPTLDIASRHQNIFCGLGIHPHSAMGWNNEVREEIASEIDRNENVIAIGEIGLDYYYDFCPKEQQIKAFREQIELAIAKKKPIIIHTRDSIDETLAIIGKFFLKKRLAGIRFLNKIVISVNRRNFCKRRYKGFPVHRSLSRHTKPAEIQRNTDIQVCKDYRIANNRKVKTGFLFLPGEKKS